jgi:hypothetical protein
VSMNEREKAVNGRGEKEDMKGKNTREKGIFVGSILFHIGRLYWSIFFIFGEIGRLYY